MGAAGTPASTAGPVGSVPVVLPGPPRSQPQQTPPRARPRARGSCQRPGGRCGRAPQGAPTPDTASPTPCQHSTAHHSTHPQGLCPNPVQQLTELLHFRHCEPHRQRGLEECQAGVGFSRQVACKTVGGRQQARAACGRCGAPARSLCAPASPSHHTTVAPRQITPKAWFHPSNAQARRRAQLPTTPAAS